MSHCFCPLHAKSDDSIKDQICFMKQNDSDEQNLVMVVLSAFD